jgi:hypothetical protein
MYLLMNRSACATSCTPYEAAPPGYQLDEFPYACTAQGGAFGPALARTAPAWENALQGGLLGAFTRWILKGVPQPFIVVPIPL